MAVGIAQELNFDMAGLFDIALYIDIRIAERGLGFSLGGQKRAYQPDVVVAYSHAFTPASGSRFDDDGVAYLLGDFERLFLCLYYCAAARDRRNAGPFGRIFSRHLVAHKPDIFRRRPYEFNFTRFAYFGKMRILRQKSVTGMYGLNIGYFGRAYYAGYVEVAVCACGRTYAYRFIREFYVQ